MGDFLAEKIKSKLKLPRVRADTLGYPQRSFLGSTSELDQKEAFEIGKFSVKNQLSFIHLFLLINERQDFSKPYKVSFKINSLADVAGKTKIITKDFYNTNQSFITKKFINYALPLIGRKIIKTKSII